MSKSKSRRQKPTSPRRPPQKAPRRAVEGSGSAVRRSASPAFIGSVALIALVASAVLIALGGGIPGPVAKADPSAASADVPAGTVPVATAETAFEAGSPEALASLALCAGNPCPTRGPEDAPVTIIEVSDFLCSHCRDFALDTEPIVDAKYVETDQVRYIVHVFGFSDPSRAIAEAAMCANEQDAYFDFKREAFSSGSGAPPTEADLLGWARTIGLDEAEFGTCVREARYREFVAVSSDEALRAGITGTPSFIVNGELTEGNPPLAALSAQIESLVAAAGGDS